MRTITMRTFARKSAATFGALLFLSAAPLAADTPATEAAPAVAPAADRILEGRGGVGYRATDVEDDRSLLFPYDPLTDGPILGLDLLYLTPQIGSLKLEAGFLDADAWRSELSFSHGSDVGIVVGGQAYTHARSHSAPVPEVAVVASPVLPQAGMEVHGEDADPGRVYRDERREATARMKIRIPGYPAHLSASGKIDQHRGEQQMRNFYRTCAAHLCHADSRTRELDQETAQWTLGGDAHLGPVDLAVSHTALTYRDNAADPLAPAGDLSSGSLGLKGDVPYDVNPDLKSGSTQVALNSSLTNRMVFSLVYTDGLETNESSDISRHARNGGAEVSYRVNASTFVSLRYTYYEELSGDLGEAATTLRADRNKAQAATRHQHALDPREKRQLGELVARFRPLPALDLGARLRYRTQERYAVIDKDPATNQFVDEADTTDSTLAGIEGRYRVSPALSFDGSLGREWTEGVVYATENTGLTRFGLGATWAPAPVFLLRASWQGFRGENDDRDALQKGIATLPADRGEPTRSVSGDAFLATATLAPAPAFSLTASWGLTENGVEQDMIFGSPANNNPNPAGNPTKLPFSFLSPDTSWSCRNQVANLSARWEATKRLALTAAGMWIDNLESYTPDLPAAPGVATNNNEVLEETSSVDYTKLLFSLQVEARLTDRFGVTVTAFWADFDDQVDDASDGTAQGVLAALDYRW